jgi:hypothetical protein
MSWLTASKDQHGRLLRGRSPRLPRSSIRRGQHIAVGVIDEPCSTCRMPAAMTWWPGATGSAPKPNGRMHEPSEQQSSLDSLHARSDKVTERFAATGRPSGDIRRILTG